MGEVACSHTHTHTHKHTHAHTHRRRIVCLQLDMRSKFEQTRCDALQLKQVYIVHFYISVQTVFFKVTYS